MSTVLPNVEYKILNAIENNDGHMVCYTDRAAFMTPAIVLVINQLNVQILVS